VSTTIGPMFSRSSTCSAAACRAVWMFIAAFAIGTRSLYPI
jgi:hypothetical protein